MESQACHDIRRAAACEVETPATGCRMRWAVHGAPMLRTWHRVGIGTPVLRANPQYAASCPIARYEWCPVARTDVFAGTHHSGTAWAAVAGLPTGQETPWVRLFADAPNVGRLILCCSQRLTPLTGVVAGIYLEPDHLATTILSSKEWEISHPLVIVVGVDIQWVALSQSAMCAS